MLIYYVERVITDHHCRFQCYISIISDWIFPIHEECTKNSTWAMHRLHECLWLSYKRSKYSTARYSHWIQYTYELVGPIKMHFNENWQDPYKWTLVTFPGQEVWNRETLHIWICYAEGARKWGMNRTEWESWYQSRSYTGLNHKYYKGNGSRSKLDIHVSMLDNQSFECTVKF